MSRTNVDIDDELIAGVMRQHGLSDLPSDRRQPSA
jgi:Arc/MetJ family transcription regulator